MIGLRSLFSELANEALNLDDWSIRVMELDYRLGKEV
jgi:hypothetical protein